MFSRRTIEITITAVVAVSWAARDARADRGHDGAPRATVALSPSLGGLTALQATGMLALDASWRTEDPDWWVRGEAATGSTWAIDEGSGSLYELRAGLEHRVHACGGGCLYYGVDVAFVSGELRDLPDQWQLTGGLAIPRGGIDVGGDRVRFRVGVELPLGLGNVHDVEPDLVVPVDSTRTRFVDGFALTTALVVAID